MRLANWVVQGIVVATFFALLLAPEKWGYPLGLVSLGIVGAWALLYPQGVLGWANNSYVPRRGFLPTIGVKKR
jgi:hypothetical protein